MKKWFFEYRIPLQIVFISLAFVFFSTQLFSQDIVQKEDQVMQMGEPDNMQEDFRSTFIITYNDNLAPLSYVQDGEIKGILVDIMQLILVERLGKEVEHRGYSWKRAQFMVKTENADAFCTSPSSVRKRYARFTSIPVFVSSPAIFSGINNPRKSGIETIGSIDGVRAFSLVDYLGSPWARNTLPKDILDTMHWVGSLDTVLRMLAINRYDIYIGDGIIGKYTLMNLGLADDIFTRTVTIGKSSQYYFAVRKTHPEAQDIVKEVEHSLKEVSGEGLIERIIQGYITPQRTVYPSQ